MAQRLVPFLGYEDAAAAIDWLCTAFGAIGYRIYSAEDLEGHRWMFGQKL
jgi:uncharacterized glyoxalase superfamily protein PhnB